jgi:hypothetical protein
VPTRAARALIVAVAVRGSRSILHVKLIKLYQGLGRDELRCRNFTLVQL